MSHSDRLVSCISLRWEETVKKSNLIYAVAPVIFGLSMACSAISGEKRDANGDDSSSGDTVTVAGCLTADGNGNYALTAAPEALGVTVARNLDDERDTKSYVLVGGENLQGHLGKRVEVTGTLAGKSVDMEHKDTKTTEQPPAAGGDNNQPIVRTKEEIDLEARQLQVREIKDVAVTCTNQ